MFVTDSYFEMNRTVMILYSMLIIFKLRKYIE